VAGQVQEDGREHKVGFPIDVVDGFFLKDAARAVRGFPSWEIS